MRYTTNNCIYIYINLLHYIQRDVLCNISFKEHIFEDGHSRWPKHVGGYAVSNTINLRVCMRIWWSNFSIPIKCFVPHETPSEIRVCRSMSYSARVCTEPSKISRLKNIKK
jgi:hypothetical protein